jgi:hypothetical protein
MALNKKEEYHMSPVSVNAQTWDDVEEQERGVFPVFEPGVYEGYFKDVEAKEVTKGKNKGNTYYKPEFVVRNEEGSEIHVWGYWSTDPQTRGVMKKDLVALNVDLSGVDIDDEEELLERIRVAGGTECRVRLRIRQYDDEDDDGNPIKKDVNDIRAILPA